MTNEYWKKRAEQLPHHEPAHKSQNKNLDDFLNQVPGMPTHPQQQAVPNNNGGWGERDIGAALAARIAQSQMNNIPGNDQQRRPQAQVVFVKEGVQAYRQLEAQAYGNSMPLVRFLGPVEGINGREFEYKGIVEAYVIEGNGPVDMANPNPAKIKKLVVVQAPFIGKLLIPESFVISQNRPQQILKG